MNPHSHRLIILFFAALIGYGCKQVAIPEEVAQAAKGSFG
jgi:hypothetical protein